MTSHRGEQAIVIGAGMSGLTAAGALARHFKRVVVLERDELPPAAKVRAGTPQARHLHVLLGGGLRALGELFPGLERDFIEAGAVAIRTGLDIRFEAPGYDPFPQRDLGWVTYAASRPLIEFLVRQRIQRQANIALHRGCRALAIVPSTNGAAVGGVYYEVTDGTRDTLRADLVVDASARGALTLALLRSVGRPPPEETVIGVDIRYATATFAIPDDAPLGWKGVITFPKVPDSSRRGYLLPLEGNRWMLTLSGQTGDHPPGDGQGFLNYAQGLRTPTIFDAIRRAQRLGGIVRFGFAASVRRHFERISPFPRGLLPIGDALCRFNPIHGQGMSVAAKEACLVDQLLRIWAGDGDPGAGLADAFLSQVGPLLDSPWALSAIPDLASPHARGQRPPDLEAELDFGSALYRIAAIDPAVHRLTAEVQHLIKPHNALSNPDLVGKVRAFSKA